MTVQYQRTCLGDRRKAVPDTVEQFDRVPLRQRRDSGLAFGALAGLPVYAVPQASVMHRPADPLR